MRVCWCEVVLLLMLVVGGMAPVHARYSRFGDLPSADDDFLRFQPAQWINLSVDIEEHVAGVQSSPTEMTIGSLTVLPKIVVTWPKLRMRPYLDAGLGLRIGGFTDDTASIPLSLRFEETLMLKIEGGIAYDLGKGFSLTGSTYFSRLKTTNLLSQFSTPTFSFVQDDLDENSYTVELGLRLAY